MKIYKRFCLTHFAPKNLCAQIFVNVHQSGWSLPYHGYIHFHPRAHSNIYFRYSYRSNRISSGTAITKLKVLLKHSLQYIKRYNPVSSIKIILLVTVYSTLWLSRLRSTNRQTSNLKLGIAIATESW